MEGTARRATLEQDSGAQGALMAIDNTTGDVLAMVGGRDYALSQFNRATQAERQTGSSFKPYVYTAAIEDGAKPTDIIVDAPVSFGGYTPHNYENDYKGADDADQRLCRVAQHSRAQAGRARGHSQSHRHGPPLRRHLRTFPPICRWRWARSEITLEEQVATYSVFPNDGIRVTPRLIRKVSNADGITLWEDRRAVNEVIDQQTARTMMMLLQPSRARHRRGGRATEASAGRQDRHHQRLHRRLVPGLFALGHLRRLGGLRQPPVAGRKGNRRKAALPIWMT